MADIDSPAVRSIDAQTLLVCHIGCCGRSRTINDLNVAIGVQVHLPLVEFIARGAVVGTRAELHYEHRVVVGIHRVQGLHIVRPRHTIAVTSEKVYLRIVDVGIG